MRISDWSSDVCSSDLGLQVARFGNGGDDLRERRIEVALQVLALRLGQRVFGQETHGALVLLALGDLRLRADVVQQRPQEGLLEGEAGDAEFAGRLHPEIARRAGEEVVTGAVAGLAEGDRQSVV